MSSYTPEGKAHRLLRRLESGPASFNDLRVVLGAEARSRRHKAWWLVGSVLSDGLIVGASSEYVITRAGLDALQALDAGHPVGGIAAVRVFA